MFVLSVVKNFKTCVLVLVVAFAVNAPTSVNLTSLLVGVVKLCPSIETFTSFGTFVNTTLYLAAVSE